MEQRNTESYHRSRKVKRPQACQACRESKIRCIPLEGSESCRACKNHSRPCFMSGPPNKRIKSSQKFSELEEKIQVLTRAIASRERHKSSQGLTPSVDPVNPRNSRLTSASEYLYGAHDQRHEDASTSSPREHDLNSRQTSADVIDQGLLTMQNASTLFNHWNLEIRPLLPIVFPTDCLTAEQMRAMRPTLFLAILTIASSSVNPSITSRLVTELSELLAQQIFVSCIQSLELIQALLLYAHYYIRPCNAEHFAVSQHVYSAITMAHDFGLDKKAYTKPLSLHDRLYNLEAARTWLACYHACSVTRTLLQRSALVFSSSEIQGYVELLSNSPDAQLSDRWLCSLVQLQQIVEEASSILDPAASRCNRDFGEASTQRLLMMMQCRLDDWKNSETRPQDPRLKNHLYYSATLFVRRIVVSSYLRHMSKTYGKDSSSPSLSLVTASHFEALQRCVEACQEVLTIYTSFETPLARSLPNTYLLWNVHAAVCLIRLGHFVQLMRPQSSSGVGPPADQPNAEEIITKSLDAVIMKLNDILRDGHLPQATQFSILFRKLKLWYQHKRRICVNSRNCDDPDDPESALDTLGQNSRNIEPMGRPETLSMPSSLPDNIFHPEPPGGLMQTQGRQSVAIPRPEVTQQPSLRPTQLSDSLYGQLPNEHNNIGFTLTESYDALSYDMTELDDLVFGDDDIRQMDEFLLDDTDTWIKSWM